MAYTFTRTGAQIEEIHNTVDNIYNTTALTFNSLNEALSSTKIELNNKIIIGGYNINSDGGYSTFEVVNTVDPIGILNHAGTFKLKRMSGHSQLKDTLSYIAPVRIAHRGYHGISTNVPVGSGVDEVYFVPENTKYSCEFAAKMGAWGVEGDTKLTLDGKAIVQHDTTVDRTTTSTGNVDSFTLAEIKAMDAGSYVSDKFKDARIMDYDDYFYHCRKNSIFPMCEWSVNFMSDEQADDFVATALKYYPDGVGCCLYSGYVPAIKKIRERNANIVVGSQAGYGVVPSDELLDTVYELGNGFISLTGAAINDPLIVQKIKDRGLVLAYGIANTPAMHENCIEKGVDMIISDLL